MIIAIDFDGTCVTHEYPAIGQEIGAVPVLRELAAKHQLILWTMRSGPELAAAVAWFAEYGIELWGVNENPQQKEWTSSPKAYAHLYIDDAALGIPLVHSEYERPYVDWHSVRQLLKGRGDAMAHRNHG